MAIVGTPDHPRSCLLIATEQITGELWETL
jgi:hypothetical protein